MKNIIAQYYKLNAHYTTIYIDNKTNLIILARVQCGPPNLKQKLKVYSQKDNIQFSE